MCYNVTVIGDVIVRALCDNGATFTLIASQLAFIVPKTVVGKKRLGIEMLGDVLEGEFEVVELTVQGINLPNTCKVVVIEDLSGVVERVEGNCYPALQVMVGGYPIFADLTGPGVDNIAILFGEDCYDTIVQGMTLVLIKEWF